MDSNRDQKVKKIFAVGRSSEKIQSFNWDNSLIGAIGSWPYELICHINRILESGFPMVIWWGEDHLQFSNDACCKLSHNISAFTGLDLIGISPQEACPQLWPQIKPKIEHVYRGGGPLYIENESVFSDKSSSIKEIYWTSSFDPLRNEDGAIAGVVAVFKETNHLYRRLEKSRQEQSELLKLNDTLARVVDPDDKEIRALSSIGTFLNVDRLGFAELESDSADFSVKRCYIKKDMPVLNGQYMFMPSPENDRFVKFSKGESLIDNDVRISNNYNDIQQKAFVEFNIKAVLSVPVTQAGKLVAVFFAHMSQPYVWQKAEISFVRQAAVRIWETLLVARSKAELSESELRYRTLFESLDEGFMVIDFLFDDQGCPKDYRFLQVNPAFERQSGLKCELGKTILEIMPDIEKRWIKKYGLVATSRCPLRFQDYNHSTDRWYEVYAAPMENSRSQVVVVFKDITESKKEEQRKEDFLSVASHELKTPITALNGYLYMLRRSTQSNEHSFVQHFVDGAVEQTARMLRLINSFLDISQLNAGHLELKQEDFDLALLLRQMMEDLIVRNSAYHFEYNVPSQLTLRGDRIKIAQVIANLLDNAAKYSPRGSRIQMNCCIKEGEVMLAVEDQGIGLAAEEFEKIFDRFYRADSRRSSTISGFGIGLFVCKEIIKMHGGSIGVFSELGVGSTFWLTLPLQEILPNQAQATDQSKSEL